MQACADGDLGGGCGSDGTSLYILDKYLNLKKTGTTTFWDGLHKAEQNALSSNDWNSANWEDAIGGPGVTPADPLYDPAVWITGLFGAGRISVVGISYLMNSAGSANAICVADRRCNQNISLYRAVSKAELDDIMDKHIFRPKPGSGSMDAKWFWEQASSAKGFSRIFPSLNNYVKITIPKNIIELGYRVHNLDNLGPAVSFIDDSLDALNNAIISIEQIIQ